MLFPFLIKAWRVLVKNATFATLAIRANLIRRDSWLISRARTPTTLGGSQRPCCKTSSIPTASISRSTCARLSTSLTCAFVSTLPCPNLSPSTNRNARLALGRLCNFIRRRAGWLTASKIVTSSEQITNKRLSAPTSIRLVVNLVTVALVGVVGVVYPLYRYSKPVSAGWFLIHTHCKAVGT